MTPRTMLELLNENDGQVSSTVDYGNMPGSGIKGAKFNGFLINNNPITYQKREYILEVEGLPCSHKGHRDHKKWTQFLEDNPHVISNFDTRDPHKLQYLFERWKLMHNNA